jgi:hypothetical protein
MNIRSKLAIFSIAAFGVVFAIPGVAHAETKAEYKAACEMNGGSYSEHRNDDGSWEVTCLYNKGKTPNSLCIALVKGGKVSWTVDFCV